MTRVFPFVLDFYRDVLTGNNHPSLNSHFKISVIFKSMEKKKRNVNQKVELDIVVAMLYRMVVWNEELLSPLVHADNTRSLAVWKRNGSVS